jgi:hypothetical protein
VTPAAPRLNPAKLARSKWTAVTPRDREKHFMVIEVLTPPPLAQPVPVAPTDIVIEAVHSRRQFTIGWRELRDVTVWRQGWL